MTTPEELLSTLQEIEALNQVPETQLLWLIERGSCVSFKEGDYTFRAGDAIDYMDVILRGQIRLYIIQQGSQREIGRFNGKGITGVLPFSRMTHAQASGEVLADTIHLRLHRKYFREMVSQHYELTEALVQFMSSRVRSFTRGKEQTEKLVSLGRLSAGLAHELNNPASAIVRSATTLQSHLSLMPDDFKHVFRVQLSMEDVDAIGELIFSKIRSCNPDRLSLAERTELEDDLAAELEANGMEDGYEMAENLIEFGFVLEDLEALTQRLPADDFLPVMRWINNNLLTERMVKEIGDAAQRIGGIIGAVKSYTHMDQAQEVQPVPVLEGLKSTLVMLQHKIKTHQIEITKNFEAEELFFNGIPGQINQIWTNVLDNAIDAVKNVNKPKIILSVVQDKKSILISIEDNGTGIPEDIQAKIFDPFFTTKKIGEGTGIGLDVVNQIVNDHGGKVELVSKAGQTIFKFCFPK